MFFTKDWIKSKTVWTGLIGMLAGILMLAFGVDVQAAGVDPKEWVELALTVVTILTSGGSIVFRLMSVASLVPKALTEVEKVKDAIGQAGKQPQPDSPAKP